MVSNYFWPERQHSSIVEKEISDCVFLAPVGRRAVFLPSEGQELGHSFLMPRAHLGRNLRVDFLLFGERKRHFLSALSEATTEAALCDYCLQGTDKLSLTGWTGQISE